MAESKQKSEKEFKAYKPAAKFCPKCGARMAEHADRFTCGKCGYTEWKEKK
ncbi:MAG: 30S ribosomal protein S27ae [Candidatus Micrarchaeia archaeon]